MSWRYYMTHEEIKHKLDVWNHRSKENAVHCSKSITKVRNFIDDHYVTLSHKPDSVGDKFHKLADCLAYCRFFHMTISSLMQGTIVMYDAIRLTIEDYVNTNNCVKSNPFQKEYDLEAACKFMDNLCDLIWRFDSCLTELTRLDPDTDFRKRKNFKTIMEVVNGENSNFIDLQKVLDKIHDFEKKTEYAADYMSFVFNEKSSYTIKDDYINIFDAIIFNIEFFRDIFVQRLHALYSEVRLQYLGKDAYMDHFAFFVTNSIWNDLCFTVFVELESLCNSAKFVMPKDA